MERRENQLLAGRLKGKHLGRSAKFDFKRVALDILDFVDAHCGKTKNVTQRTQFLRYLIPLGWSTLNQMAFLTVRPVESYTGPATMWKWLLYLRIDYLAQLLSADILLLYCLWLTTLLLTSLILATLIALIRKKVVPIRLKRAFLSLSKGAFQLFPIAFASLLVGDFLSEVRDGELPIKGEKGNWAASGVCLGLALGVFGVRAVTEVEVLCHPKLWRVAAKGGVEESGVEAVGVLGSCFGYYLIAPQSETLFFGLFTLLHFACCLYYLMKLPFYTESTNLLHLLSSLLLASSSLSLLISTSTNSPNTAVALILIAFPAAAAGLQSCWHSLYAGILVRKVDDVLIPQSRSSIFLIFKAISTSTNQEAVFPTLKSLRNHSPGCIYYISILESCYTLHVIRNEGLARLQLSRKSLQKPSILDLFLKFRLWRRLEYCTSLEEVEYLRCLEGLMTVQKTDEKVCRNLAELWGELASCEAKGSKINGLIGVVCQGMLEAKRLYGSLISSCPENPLLLSSYATFLNDVLNRPDKASVWATKAYAAKEVQLRETHDSEVYFSQGNAGVIIASLDPKDVGRIVYFNEMAAYILQYDVQTFSNLKLFALLPPPFNTQHVKYLCRFSHHRETTTLNHPSPLPLFTSHRFILECTAKLAVTSISGPAMLLVAFRPRATGRELAVIGSEGEICAHSQGFPASLGRSDYSLAGSTLWDCCGPESQSALLDTRFRIRSKPNAYGMLCSVLYQTQLVKKLIVYNETLNKKEPPMMLKVPQKIGTRMPSALDLLKSSGGGEAVRITDRRASVRLWSLPPMISFLGLTKETGSQRVLQSYDKKMTLAGIVAKNSPLKPGVQNGLNRVYSTLTFVTVLVVVLMIAWSIAICVYLITVSQGLISESISIELSQQVLHTLRIAGQGRFLDLTNAGYFPDYMTVNVKMHVNESIAVLEDVETKVWAHLKAESGKEFEKLYMGTEVSTWEMEGGVAQERGRNLINAMKVFVEHSRMILSLPLSQLSIHHPSVFFVVQNGMKGKLITTLHDTLTSFQETEQAAIESNVYQIIYLVVFVFLTLGAALLISVPVLTKLQLYVGQVSDVLAGLPLSLCLDNKKRILERLNQWHDIKLEIPVDKPKAQEARMIIYKPLLKLVGPIVGFFCACVVLYLVLFFKGVTPLVNYVSELPGLMRIYSFRFTCLLDLWTWTVEAIFMQSSRSLFLAIPSPSFQLSPLQEIEMTATFLHTVNRRLIEYATSGYVPLSIAHSALMVAEGNYTTPMLKLGLRTGVNSFVADVYLCGNYRGASAEMYTDCGNLYSAAEEFMNISKDVMGFVQDDFRIEVGKRAWAINAWLLLWTGCGICCLLFCTLPLLYHSKRHIRRMIALSSLVYFTPVQEPADTKNLSGQTGASEGFLAK